MKHPTISVRSTVSGIVNGQAIKGNVVATIDPNRGGLSSCEFSKLPRNFIPSSIGTFM